MKIGFPLCMMNQFERSKVWKLVIPEDYPDWKKMGFQK